MKCSCSCIFKLSIHVTNLERYNLKIRLVSLVAHCVYHCHLRILTKILCFFFLFFSCILYFYLWYTSEIQFSLSHLYVSPAVLSKFICQSSFLTITSLGLSPLIAVITVNNLPHLFAQLFKLAAAVPFIFLTNSRTLVLVDKKLPFKKEVPSSFVHISNSFIGPFR